MTYGVPYSFVPGTKAKADEVNANFVDVLEKISDSNTRIDTKADAADIDGSWTYKYVTLIDGESVTANQNKTYSLASYLPEDNNIYEVIFTGTIECSSSSGNYANINVKSSLCSYVPIGRFSGTTKIDGHSATIPIGADHEIAITSTKTQSGSMTIGLKANAYRKVR